MEHMPGLLPQLGMLAMQSCEAGSPCRAAPWKEELLMVSPGRIYPAEHG